MAKIDAFFKLMHEQGASDLHLTASQPPSLRIRGDIERIKYKVLDNDDLRGMLYEITPEEKIKVFEETGDVDFGYEIPGLARYRANFFMQKNGIQRNSHRYHDRRTARPAAGNIKTGDPAQRPGAGDWSYRQRQIHDVGIDHRCGQP